MKLSFSTKGWHLKSFYDYVRIAEELGFEGIELHNVNGAFFNEKDGAFYGHYSGATLRMLYEKNLKLPCIDALTDFADPDQAEACEAEVKKCLAIAKTLRIPAVRIKTGGCEEAEALKRLRYEAAQAMIRKLLPEAEKLKITLLIETDGLFADTAVLRDVLENFASDYLAALWNFQATSLYSSDTPGKIIANLGAYVRQVHVSDAKKNPDGTVEHCLLGEGELPIGELMLALRSVNYDGFTSLVWHPEWMPELSDMEIILTQFENYMKQFDDPSKGRSTLYDNKRHNGKFVWKKDILIDETFSGVLDRMVKEFPDQLAFKYTTLDYTRTYKEFRDDVNECARALVALGVKAGSHVAVWASNVPEWYITFWATVKIGAVLVTVNTAYKIAEVEYLLKQSDTHTIIITEGNKDIRYGDIITQICPELKTKKPNEALHAKRLPFLRNVITAGFRQPGCLTFQEMLQLKSQVPQDEIDRMAAAVDKNDVCNMQYTSGTTGFPKGVMLTHYNIVNNGKCIGDRMDLSSADRMMIQVPMFHCFGMVLAMTATMTHGGTLLPLPYFSPRPALSCIHNEHITAFHGVPTMFISMLEHPDFEKTDFSYMRTGIMAGSPCPIATMRDVVEKMHMTEITIVYGQTEASPGCTMSSTDDSLELRVTTVGKALPEIECKIVDPETGEDCPDNVNGEFLARGYNLMKGYYKMPKETAETIDKDGWLHTGDLACRTPEGYYKITGRLKDMIIRGGENIYPKEIEEFIYTNPKVSDVQVIGVPSEQYGEEIMACVILKQGETMTEQELKDFVGASMARHKVPKYVDFVDSFPMNAAGKILKYQMRKDAVEKLGLQKAAGIVTA